MNVRFVRFVWRLWESPETGLGTLATVDVSDVTRPTSEVQSSEFSDRKQPFGCLTKCKFRDRN